MNWLINNWYLIIILFCALCAMVCAVSYFLHMPSDQQIENVKEWLKWAVVQAEKELHEKTGALKLRMVYDMAVEKFPWIADIVPFAVFSCWVDEALEWMERQLASNKAVNDLVKGE